MIPNVKMYKDLIEKSIDNYLNSSYPELIYEAMRYSALADGKRLRPTLLIATADFLGVNINRTLPFAVAIELIHTYSLIHDDLPDLDDDDLRRGKPTNHKVFGADVAILAGDGLLNFAYEIMSSHLVENFSIENAKAMNIIANAAGVNGMVGGQVVDVISSGKKVDEVTLRYIHKNKTAALIKAALVSGAIIGQAKDISLYENAGEKLGEAFQIMDDILDVTSSDEELGKPVNSDEKNKKNTFVSMYGLDEVKKMYNDICKEVTLLFKEINSPFLSTYVLELINRVK